MQVYGFLSLTAGAGAAIFRLLDMNRLAGWSLTVWLILNFIMLLVMWPSLLGSMVMTCVPFALYIDCRIDEPLRAVIASITGGLGLLWLGRNILLYMRLGKK